MRRALSLGATVLLFGCGGDSGSSVSGGAPKDTTKRSEFTIRPGLWESKIETRVVDMAPLPTNTSRKCVSLKESQEAAKVFTQTVEGRECSSQHLTMQGGKIDARMTCQQEGTQSTITVAGTYSDDAYDIDTRITGLVSGAEEPMNLQSRTTARRLGDCPANEGAPS